MRDDGDREPNCDEQLPEHLRRFVEAEAPASADLYVVVDESNDPHADHRGDDDGSRPAEVTAREVRADIAGDDGRDDHDAAHRRRPPLFGVVTDVAPVLSQALPEAEL